MQKCDISRIPPLATPCALPSKQRDETASICDGKEGEFVSFDVIGTDQINDMQVAEWRYQLHYRESFYREFLPNANFITANFITAVFQY